jgi:hypothetical protein
MQPWSEKSSPLRNDREKQTEVKKSVNPILFNELMPSGLGRRAQ